MAESAIERVRERKVVRISPSGLVCPKDPNKDEDSVDGEGGPTHLQADVLKIETPDEKKPYRKRATLRCRAIVGKPTDDEPAGKTCGNTWQVDWPPRT